MITISAAMIVKNEEAVLARCLDSLLGIADEIVIVDTGSTDKTKEIAAKYTNHLYDFVWGDDFSAARNFAFSKCHMDYIYSADADEWLDEENRQKFLQLKEVMLSEIEIVQMQYVNCAGKFNTTGNFEREYRGKLYKRLREFMWQDPVHETVRLTPLIFDSDIEILHMPHSLHGGRDFQLLYKTAKKSLELTQAEAAAQFSKKLHHMYAMELFIAGADQDFLDAEEIFSRSQLQDFRSQEEVVEAVCVCARAARLRGDIPTFFKYAMKAAAVGCCAEICCELGKYYISAGDLEEACLWFYNAAAETESVLDIRSSQEQPRKALADLCRRIGRQEEAEEWAKQLYGYEQAADADGEYPSSP